MTVQVKALLKGEDLHKFKTIKEKLGVLHDSEVIRVLINNEYKQINCPKKEASS